jgi:GntR family transcriptional repressor for pyruvate dehydrogenase complex
MAGRAGKWNLFSGVEMKHRSNEVVALIEGAMLNGEIAPGERLPSEEKLCERYKASRTVIREALQQLRGRGLVRTLKGSGTYVADVTLEPLGQALNAYTTLAIDADFTELIGFRILLETECARLAARRANPELITKLREIHARMDTLIDELDAFSSADIEFHLAIAEASGNRIYATILNSLQRRCIEYAQANRGSHERYQRTVDAHRGIVDAIDSGDSDLAAAAMNAHLQASRRQFADKDSR